jgi:hypothetical protein
VSAITSFIADAFEDHLVYLNVTAVVSGVVLSALPAEAEVMASLELGGITEQADGAIIFRKDSVGSLPRSGEKILVDNKPVRVHSINYSKGNPLVTIEYIGTTER